MKGFREGIKTIRKSTINTTRPFSDAIATSPHDEAKHRREYEHIQNKTKEMIEHSNYVRKKHFKSTTLRYGEGALFVTKGLTNKDYEESILKKSLQ